jgi:hypothetical protein
MSVVPRSHSRLRIALILAVWFAAALALTVRAQPPEPPKGPANGTSAPAPKELPGIRLPDGTFLWFGSGDGDERVSLTPRELQKLQDQIDQLKKQLAARRASAPSGCAIRGRVEKRGEQLVAVLKLTLSFRTTAAKTPMALGGKKAFLVAASLDGGKLPILETVEDGFAAVIETAGEHTLTLELEAPVTARGAKAELGFELGLPRAAITTLLLEPPDPAVKRINLTTRTSDPAQPMRPAEPRRVPALDVKQLAARAGQETGYALGPVDSLEVTWEPPASSAQPADRVQSAELDLTVLLTESVAETTARIKLHGPARQWHLVAPANAIVSASRAVGASDLGPAQAPTVLKPASAAKPIWTIEFPAGSTPADWVIAAVARGDRPKADEPKHRGPFPIGPFSVLDVLRQTGTVRVTAGPHSRFVFKHGADLRRDVAPGPVEDEVTSAFFRLATGPTGNTAPSAPLLTVEVWRLLGRITIKPAYKLTLTEAGWKVRAELKVAPIGRDMAALAVNVPAEWRGLEPTLAELVDGIQPGPATDGFWEGLVERATGETRVPMVVRFSANQKQPFDLVLTATVPVPPGTTEAAIRLPRVPGATEAGATLPATVPDGLEIHGESRGWDGNRAAASGTPLAPVAANGKSARAVTAVVGQADAGFARALLAWKPYRPDLTADVRADLTLLDRQLVIQEVVKLRAPDALPRSIRFHGPPSAAGLKVQTAQVSLEMLGPGDWKLNLPPDVKEFALSLSYAIPLTPHAAADPASHSIPVGLLWPTTATRAETTVRVWSNTVAAQAIAIGSPGWRELPIEAVENRDALPMLVLAASGGENPLVLEASEIEGGAAVALWVDRGLIQAGLSDDGAIRYRARFLVRRWLAPAIEVRLPALLAGSSPEFLRDDQRIDATPILEGDGTRAFRIPLPEARPGRTSLIEIRYQLPASRDGDTVYRPPLLPPAAFAGPVRWSVTLPTGWLPLLTAGATPETRWRWRGGVAGPRALGSTDELTHWLMTGEEPAGREDSADETITARQALPGALSVHRVPRVAFTILCSVVAFAIGIGILRLSLSMTGVVLALGTGAIGIAATLWPQPMALAAGACQPGVFVVLVVYVFLLAVRSYHRHRVMNLPGFARTALESAATPIPVKGPSTARNRPATVGSSGAAPPSPSASIAPPGS